MLVRIIRQITLNILNIKFIVFANYYHFRKLKIAFVCSTPIHSNLGDHAIAYAEKQFVKNYLNKYRVIDIPFVCCKKFIKHKQNLVVNGDLIMIIGGGNMGDLYLPEEICRRELIQNFLNNRVVIFPQTIHFKDDYQLQKTVDCYSKHKKLIIIAREQKSYEDMKNRFIKNKVIITPDIVLSTSPNYELTNLNRDGVLVCLRNDIEKLLNDDDMAFINKFINKNFSAVKVTDTISKKRIILPSMRIYELNKKFREFSVSRLVITDRLHGMIFAAITGTPCIVFSNNNHKVFGTYDWISNLSYVKFCKNLNELEILYDDIDFDSKYIYNPSIFDKYWNEIKLLVDGDE